MAEERYRSLNAVVTCVSCRLSFMLTNMGDHEKFEVITSATEEYTLYIPIDTICLYCLQTFGKDPWNLMGFTKAKDVANALFPKNDVNLSKDTSLSIYQFPNIFKKETEIVELEVQVEQPTEHDHAGLVVTKTPYVSGRMLLQIYGEP